MKTEKMRSCNERHPNQCHCAFRCLGNEFCDGAEDRIISQQKRIEELEIVRRAYENMLFNSEQKLKQIEEIIQNKGKIINTEFTHFEGAEEIFKTIEQIIKDGE